VQHSSFDRARGNTSIGVLGLMVLLTSLTLGYCQHIQTLILRGRALPYASKKAHALGNALQEIRIDGHRERTETVIADQQCQVRWQYEHRDGVRLERVEAIFPEHPSWPVAVGFWVHIEGRDLLIHHYRYE